jgi:hypothetical protein
MYEKTTVRIRSSLLVITIYNYPKLYNYLQAHIHQTQTYLQVQLKGVYKSLHKYKSDSKCQVH